jgi:hypothetical protein
MAHATARFSIDACHYIGAVHNTFQIRSSTSWMRKAIMYDQPLTEPMVGEVGSRMCNILLGGPQSSALVDL